MKIVIGASTDISQYVVDSSFTSNCTQTDHSFSFECHTTGVLIGQECRVYDKNDELLYGGIVYTTNIQYVNVGKVVNYVTVGSYVVRLQGRNIKINKVYDSIDDIVGTFSGILAEEGITLGTIDSAFIDCDTINYDAISIADLLDTLCNAGGCVWWITKNKVLNVMPQISYNSVDKVLSDKDTYLDKFNCFKLPVVTDDLNEYTNKIFIIGQEYAYITNVGSYTETAEVTKMSSRYGSGVYGKIENIRLAQTKTVLDKLAKEMYYRLDKSHKIEFDTFDRVDPGDYILVDLELAGINSYYIADTVELRMHGEKEIYHATLRKYTDGNNKTRKSNREIMNGLLRNNKDQKASTPDTFVKYKYTTNSGDYMITPTTPYYISSVKASFIRDNVQCRVFVKVRGNNVSAAKLKADLYIMQDYGDTTSEPVLVLSGWKPAATGPFNEVWFCDVDVNRGDYAFVVEVAVDSGQFDIPPKGAEVRFESIYLTDASSVPLEPWSKGVVDTVGGTISDYFNAIIANSYDSNDL